MLTGREPTDPVEAPSLGDGWTEGESHQACAPPGARLETQGGKPQTHSAALALGHQRSAEGLQTIGSEHT